MFYFLKEKKKVIDCSPEKKCCGLDYSYFFTSNFWIDVTILVLNLVFYGLFYSGTGGDLSVFLNNDNYMVIFFL